MRLSQLADVTLQGLLRTKTSELRSEVTKLRRQADSLNQEQATYTTYDTRVKQMAGELLGKPTVAQSYQTGLSGVLHFFSRYFSNVNEIFNNKLLASKALMKVGAVEITDFDMQVFVKNRLVSREI